MKTPSDIFFDWLGGHDKETRVAVVIDSDRFLADAKVLDKPTAVDPAGREWRLAAFRGDDLAFRLRFRDAIAKGRTIIVLARGPDATEPIDVSCVADVLAKNEAGEPLDLSVVALFRRVAPKINFPVAELRRFKGELLARLEHVQEAADKVIQRWGKPDSWARGQVAAMVLLAYHAELNLADIWPDEVETADFLAHLVKLLVGLPQLRPHRTKDTPRYTHGGLSLAEVVVPSVVLRRVTEKVARAELIDLPEVLMADEDAIAELPVTVRNSGNCDVEFELLVVNNLGEELLAEQSSLAPASKIKLTASVLAKYKETSNREPDMNNTVTAVTLRLRHTDLQGQRRDALDGLITIPVKVKPKTVKFETDALKGFDDI